MKKITLATITLILIISISVYAAPKKYSVNFKNVPLKDFITFVSEFTGRNLVYNEGDIRGNVTISSQKEMDEKEILDIFYSVLKINGFIPIVEKNSIHIIAEKDAPVYDEEFRKTSDAETYITSVIMMNDYSAANIFPILNRMKSRTGYIELVRGLNVIVIRDYTSRINKIKEFIELIDGEASTYKFYTLPIKFAIASKVEQQILKLYGELTKNSLSTTLPVIVSDDLSNSIIIAATDKEYERISYLIKTFDTQTQVSKNAPKIYYLKNSKAEDVEKVLSKLINAIAPQGNVQTLQLNAPQKASISSDKATNSIIAIGDQELYANLDELIRKLDIPRRQVFVEALILETSIDKGIQFGVEWFAGKDVQIGDGTGGVIGGLTGSGALGGLVGSSIAGGTPTLPGGFSLGVIGNTISFGGLTFPSIGSLITAMQSTSGVNIVSNPQILTLDNEEAEVFVGENRPYVTSEKFDSNNNPIQTFDYRNVGIRLKITPQISSNDMITLAINQEVNKISPATFNASAPVTLTRTTKTTVKLSDKSIMVISGLIKDDSSITNTGIPFLSKIPLLGWLFKSQNSNAEKTNMMVFISTQIIDTVEDAEELLRIRKESIDQFTRQADKALNTKAFSKRDSKMPIDEQVKAVGNKKSYDNATIVNDNNTMVTGDNSTMEAK